MSIERARRDLSIDTIIRKKGSLYTEIFPFLSTSGLPKSVTMLVECHNLNRVRSKLNINDTTREIVRKNIRHAVFHHLLTYNYKSLKSIALDLSQRKSQRIDQVAYQ